MTREAYRNPLDVALKVGDWVTYTKGYIVAMWTMCIDRASGDCLVAGGHGSDRGEIVAIGEPPDDYLATVRWYFGRMETINIGNLVASHLVQSDLNRFRQLTRASLDDRYGM